MVEMYYILFGSSTSSIPKCPEISVTLVLNQIMGLTVGWSNIYGLVFPKILSPKYFRSHIQG